MTTDDPANRDRSTRQPGHAGWQSELAALLAEIEAARTPDAEAAVFTRLARLDPDLQLFLVAHMAAEETPEAAAFLEALAAHPQTPPAVRERARDTLAALAERGVLPGAPGAETFHSGWVQQGRECGEQIMLLGWRLADGRTEALVFLLDWRGDGLKDFYRTREMSDDEWRELLEHNGAKGAPLVEITQGEARVLLEDALAEGRRFSRPAPREYKLAQPLVSQRLLSAEVPSARRGYVAPNLAPEAVVAAYVRALHHRDYALVWDLLVPEHSARGQGSGGQGSGGGNDEERAAAIEALRQQHKHAPRRKPEVNTAPTDPINERDVTAQVVAEGEAESVERTGRRVRTIVRERYHLRRTPEGWRITEVYSA